MAVKRILPDMPTGKIPSAVAETLNRERWGNELEVELLSPYSSPSPEG
jgi:hypothetical protein